MSSTSITVPLIPFIRSAFDLDYTQSGLVISAFTLACGIGQLPAGWLADRIEPRKLLTVGISGVALAGILVGLSQTYRADAGLSRPDGDPVRRLPPDRPAADFRMGKTGAPGAERSACTISAAGPAIS